MIINTERVKNMITKRTFNKIDESVTKFISIGFEGNKISELVFRTVQGAINRWLLKEQESGIIESYHVAFSPISTTEFNLIVRYRQKHCLADTEIVYRIIV